MNRNLKNSKEVKEVLKALSDEFSLETEEVDVLQSVDRILSEDIKVLRDVPEFDRSTVDGYAVLKNDLTTLDKLKIVEDVRMGVLTEIILNKGETCYVPTGGMIPSNAEQMIMIEDITIENGYIKINENYKEGKFIVNKGEDLKLGNIVLNKDKKLSPYDIGALTTLGISKVNVYKKLNVAIISTGDELIDVNESYSLGKIYDSNTYMIYSMCEKLRLNILQKHIVKDDYDEILKYTSNAISECELVFISGGSSVGKKDYTSDILGKLGEIVINGITVKPGKPTIVSKVKNNKYIIGLPGHPLSAGVIFKTFFESFINNIYNQETIVYDEVATLESDVIGPFDRENVIMSKLKKKDGKFVVEPIIGKSGFISTVCNANSYFVVPINSKDLKKGEQVKTFIL